MFLSVEGGEGAGKSTLLEGLKAWLEDRGLQALVTREPGGTEVGEGIRNVLLHQEAAPAPMSELLLFLASRAEHLAKVIRPALEEGVVVLCDRFNHSTIAYQGYGRGLNPQAVEQQCLLACEGMQPELTFFLDLPPEEGFARVGKGRDRIEQAGLDFHHRVRDGYHELAKRESRIVTLDAREPKEALLALAIRELELRLPQKV